MNLLDLTDQGHGLRCNLMRLLVSDIAANRLLAMALMETGGVPLVAFRELRKLLKGHSQPYPGPSSQAMADQLERLLDAGMAALPLDLQEQLHFWRHPETDDGSQERKRMAWNLPETFEKTVAEGLLTWEQWADFWRIDASWLTETCLTGLLLQKGHFLVSTDFRQKHHSGHAIRQPWLGQLLDQNPDRDFQLQCMERLMDGKTLNLSGTQLREVPEVASTIQEIEAIAIGGTGIVRLPADLLDRIERVVGRKFQCRAIAIQALQQGSPNGKLRRLESQRLGMQCYEEGDFSSAFTFLQASFAPGIPNWVPRYHQYQDVGAYFGSAVETGQWEDAVHALSLMSDAPWKENPALRWENWDIWKGQILAEGKEELFYEALRNLPLRSNITPEMFFCFHWHYHWAHVFERLIYSKDLETALRFLKRSMQTFPEMSLQTFRWNRILCHFKHIRRWDEVLKLLKFLDSKDCHLPPGTTDEGLNDPRTMRDAFLALETLGEWDLLARYLGRMIRKYEKVLKRWDKVDAWTRKTWKNRMHMMWRYLQRLPKTSATPAFPMSVK
ncbi:MAG: hypothetical protein RLZZ519_2369 [Bacteroidota bacterium]|jgi:hypothetical protein